MARAEAGWVVSVTRTNGLEVEFTSSAMKVGLKAPASLAGRIPVGDTPAAPAPPRVPRTQPRAGRNLALRGAAGAGAVDHSGEAPASAYSETPTAATGPNPLPEAEAAPLLKALGLMGPAGQVRRDDRRKYNQIVHLLRLLEGVVSKLPTDREVLVVDCGCGKSQLLFILNFWMTERLHQKAFFVGLDTQEQAIDAARRLQAGLGYRNMAFERTSIAQWSASTLPDLVLSLHACDTATDEALALGIKSGAAGIVAVPCCQHEVARQAKNPVIDPVLSHPILRARFGDWLTDGLRVLALEACGYRADAVEYVSPLDTPKNIMLRAEKARRQSRRAFKEYQRICREFAVCPALTTLLADQFPAGDPGPRARAIRSGLPDPDA